MPQLKNRLPRLCRDRNQAFSWYKGKRYYHGVWDSPEAKKNYKRFITKLLENPDLSLQENGTGEVLISELTARFLKYVESRKKGKTYEGHFKRVIGFLVEIYGELTTDEFSPIKLETCRNQMLKAGTLCLISVVFAGSNMLPYFFAYVLLWVTQTASHHSINSTLSTEKGHKQ